MSLVLGDYIDLISGPAFKSCQFTDNAEDIPLVKGDNLAQGYIKWDQSKFWPIHDVDSYTKYYLYPGDVVLAMDRPWVTAGLKFARIKENDPISLVVQRVARLRAINGMSQDFLHALIGSSGFEEYIKNIMGGTNVPHISPTQIKEYKFYVDKYSFSEIGSIYSSYIDLIENNRRRIQLLEDSARLLYQEWFVHLRFPGHEQVKITDGVPEGWSCSPVDSLLGKVQKKKKVKKEEYLEAGLIPCIDQSQDFIGGYIDDEEAAITENLPIVVFGDHTRIVKFIDFPFAPGADGTQLLIPNDDEMPREFFYFMISSINVANAFYARHFKFLKTTNVLVPEKRLMIDFSTFVGDNMRQIKLLRNQNRSLAQARDLLLPKLMSGELTV